MAVLEVSQTARILSNLLVPQYHFKISFSTQVLCAALNGRIPNTLTYKETHHQHNHDDKDRKALIRIGRRALI